MSRRHRAEERDVPGDPVYKSQVVAKFINNLMNDGKKGVAERIFYGSMGEVEKKLEGVPPFEVFNTAIQNVKPHLEVKSRRVGGSTYQIPVDVREQRRQTLAIRWIIDVARKRSGNSMKQKLASELLDAYNNRGNAVKKKEDTHKMAESNRAFAHYMW